MKANMTENKATVAHQIQELALQQIDRALDYLTKPTQNYDEAIHETRRCLKRLRAILRLVKAELGKTIYARDNVYFRNLGRRLAALRDAAVMTETFAVLKKQFAQQLPRSVWREISKELSAAQPQSVEGKRNVLAVVATRLRTARARVEKWNLGFEGEAVLRQGVRNAYRRGNRAMEQALAEPTADNFHEWRKQVNHLRHQLQILQNLKIGKVKVALRNCKALAEILGLNNDLAVLSQHLQRHQQNDGKSARQTFQDLIRTRQVAFEAEAIQLGQQLYQYKAKAFIRHLLL